MSLKIKTNISLVLIFSFLFYIINLPIYSASNIVEKHIRKGISYYDDAYFEEAVVSLEKALRYELNKKDEIKTHLYLGLSKIALNKIDETKKHFKIIIQLDPTFTLDKNKFPPDVIKIINDLKTDFPIISDLNIGPREFYPYRGERPYLSFNISESDQVGIKLEAGYSTIKNTDEYISNSGKKNIYWTWSNKLINQNSLSLSLTPQKNRDEYSFKKTINLNVEMPGNLRYNSGSFSLLGKKIRKEYKYKKKIKTFPLLIIGASIAAILYGRTQKSDYDEGGTATGQLLQLFGWAYGGWTAIEVIRRVPKYTKRVRRKDNGNIKYNEKLRTEIKKMKKKIRVKLEIL